MEITLLPVYSRLADDVPAVLQARQPQGWRLSQHQMETFRALTDPAHAVEVVINTAMTGDGKSLAGQLPALLDPDHPGLLAMYPTNELLHDQARQMEATGQQWQARRAARALDSRELDELMAGDDFPQRGDALLSTLRNARLVLTNPDIFHYVMQSFYRRQGPRGDPGDRIIGPLAQTFRQFTFDEFHLFDTPQVAAVMTAMLLLRAIAQPPKPQFLFQSATPSELLLRLLERAGMSYTVVNGVYATAPDAGWRRILHQTTLSLSEGTVEQWLTEYLDAVLLPFFLARRPHAKGAIIVNSVAQAKRVVALLQRACTPHHLTVSENTGLTGAAARAASYAADILVGTSTIDVGVDFHINFLLFESRDAGSFLQRLGRLGRHDGYTRDGQTYSFDGDFAAHAVLPRWVLEALFASTTQRPAPLAAGMTLAREQFADDLRAAYPPPADLAAYAGRWGSLPAVRVIRALREPLIRRQYDLASTELYKQYSRVFHIRLGDQMQNYTALAQDTPVLLDEAISFRGGSYFEAAVYDLSEAAPGDRIKTYDLFWLVANAQLAGLEEDEFWRLADQVGTRRRVVERQEPVAFFRLLGYRAERADFCLYLDQEVGAWDANRLGQAIVLTGLQLDPDDTGAVPDVVRLNRRLAQRKVPALVCLGHDPAALKQRLRLPLFFTLYKLRSRDHFTGVIAVGREALLLDVAVRNRGLACGGQAIIT